MMNIFPTDIAESFMFSSLIFDPQWKGKSPNLTEVSLRI